MKRLLVSVLLVMPTVLPAQTPKVVAISKDANAPYFEVTFDWPKDFLEPGTRNAERWETNDGRELGRAPRLVPTDERTSHVFYHRERRSFLGRSKQPGKATFMLQYARPTKKLPANPDLLPSLNEFWHATEWVDTPITVTLDANTPNSPGALIRIWADAAATAFAVRKAQTPDFGYHAFAREALNRKHGVSISSRKQNAFGNPDHMPRRSYELTTGTSAITESLQLDRTLGKTPQGEARTVDVAKIPGITIGEHPWEKMMAGQKPSPEPLARLVPRDNYYLHFKSLTSFLEASLLAEQWGSSFLRFYEPTSRDFQLRARYEKQLCLKSSWVGKTLGPLVVRSVAVTGSDPYLKEGTDVAVLFDVKNSALFFGAVKGFLDEARKEWGKDLAESTYTHRGVKVEQFSTPLREVSLHRATVGEVIVYANSKVGLQRIIDTHQGQIPRLADSLDFQYMRTVFRLEDPGEDGFLFLSDSFIRNLVGPGLRIKEARRLEALTSLNMLTHGAFFTAWDTGKLPADESALLAGSALRRENLYVPEGKGVTWDAQRTTAVSDAYNTIHFATPLVELPIDRATLTEANEYGRFRENYIQLWRQFFDPVGIRIKLKESEVRVETYILPLLNNSNYNFLRSVSNGAKVTLDPTRIPSQTLFQWWIAYNGQERFLGPMLKSLALRLDDSPMFDKLVEAWIRESRQAGSRQRRFDERQEAEALRTIWQMPTMVGVEIDDEKRLTEGLTMLKYWLANSGGVKKTESLFQGVTVVKLEFDVASQLGIQANRGFPEAEQTFKPTIYHAKYAGQWYFSFRPEPIHTTLADIKRLEGKPSRPQDLVSFNSSVYVSPLGARFARQAFSHYYEWETHRAAVANTNAWHPLYQAGLLPPTASKGKMTSAALHWFGFVPVSPDGQPYAYRPELDEVENLAHGSVRRPTRSPNPEANALEFLQQFRSLRADLRFREDGIHTTLTIARPPLAGEAK